MLYKSLEQWCAFLSTIVFLALFILICVSSFEMFPLWAWIVLWALNIVAVCLIDIPDKKGGWHFRSCVGGIYMAVMTLLIGTAANDWREKHPKQQTEVVCKSIQKIHPRTANIYYPHTLYFLECDKGSYKMRPSEFTDYIRNGDTLIVEFCDNEVRLIGRK